MDSVSPKRVLFHTLSIPNVWMMTTNHGVWDDEPHGTLSLEGGSHMKRGWNHPRVALEIPAKVKSKWAILSRKYV